MLRGERELTRLAGAGHADQLGDGQDLVDLLACGLDGAGLADDVDHVRAEHALRMAEHGDGGGVRHVKAETGGVDQRAELGERDAFDADGRRGGGTEPGSA